MGIRKFLQGNARTEAVTTFGVNPYSVMVANSMLVATLPTSPMAAGVHGPSSSPIGPAGDPGYGVNRWAGRTPPKQNFRAVAQPVLDPQTQAVGLGAGVSGQPGLPNTGTDSSNSLVWMSAFQVGPGFGG